MRGSSEAQRLPFCARGLRVIEARLREEGRSDQTDRLTAGPGQTPRYAEPDALLRNARRVQLTPGWRNEGSASRFNVQKRFERCASVIVSSADTSNMRRPGGTGPCRSDMITTPPLRTNTETFGIARRRSTSSRCIHTAVSMTRLNSSLRVRTAAKSGKLSSSHSIIGEG